MVLLKVFPLFRLMGSLDRDRAVFGNGRVAPSPEISSRFGVDASRANISPTVTLLSLSSF
jgi:hypothetical protein